MVCGSGPCWVQPCRCSHHVQLRYGSHKETILENHKEEKKKKKTVLPNLMCYTVIKTSKDECGSIFYPSFVELSLLARTRRPAAHSTQSQSPVKGQTHTVTNKKNVFLKIGQTSSFHFIITLVTHTPLMCMSDSSARWDPVLNWLMLSWVGVSWTAASCWLKWADITCSHRMSTVLVLLAARRFRLEPHCGAVIH